MNQAQPLWRLTATDLASSIRRREVTARDAAASVLSRIEQVNPRIDALAEVMRDEALAASEACDCALAAGLAPAPLHGVPVTIKVNVDTAGHATTDGIVAAKDNIATTDSPLVASLRQAGAVIVGRSNTPAFSLRWFTDNDLHGRTLNPFDAKVTPGGSSGGAAAAVATGMGPIAHGNVDATVSAAIEQAAQWLEAVGCTVEHAEPPHFEEGARLWRQLVMDDMRRAGRAAIESMGDKGVRSALRGYMSGLEPLDANGVLEAQMRRYAIARDWAVFNALDRLT